jgi:hypothetical protein
VQNNDKVHSSYAAVVTCDGPKHGCTNNNASQGTSLHADLGSNVRARSERLVARHVTNKSAVISTYQYTRLSRDFEMGGPTNECNIFSGQRQYIFPKNCISIGRKILETTKLCLLRRESN